MEFFLPSILFLLVACGIVFFVIPRFGPLVLAIVSLILLGLGVYNHYSLFQTEYRLSTWQMGAVAYAPYIMIGALVLSIILYLFYLAPVGANANNGSAPSMTLPSAESATNPITSGINTMMRQANSMMNGDKGNSNSNSNSNKANQEGIFGERPGGNNRVGNNRPGNNRFGNNRF
jgi:branched-subunit amino acid transport protein